jgi:hypothetical protein
MLDIWPAFPIVVRVRGKEDEINDNVLAALEEHDRICDVDVDHVSHDEIEQLAGAMQVTFPALAHLDIHTFEDTASFPETLFGGSAPNLRSLRLESIAFSALPKLLLSSPGIVNLTLVDIPYSGNLSSDEMVHCLSSLTRLERLRIEFECFQPRPDSANRHPPLLARTVFPVLNTLILKGETEDVGQLLAHIEAPHLNDARIEFLHQPLHGLPLNHITFPALPKLLLSCPGLVRLSLIGIPCPGYISTDAIVECLSSLTRLERLEINFPFSQPRPDSASPRPPPLTRTVFPVLGALFLKGETECLDQILAHIEAPHLNDVRISFLDPLNFHFSQSRRSLCIYRTETFEAFHQDGSPFVMPT